MATAGSAERRGRPAKYGTVAGCGSTSSPPEREPEQCAGRRPSGCPPPAPTACRLRRTQRRPGSGERLRRSEPGRGSCAAGKRDRHPREECFVSPAIVTKCCDSSSPPTGKHKPGTEEREEAKRRTCRDKDVPGVLSDSENEEPFSRRIRNISAFIRKTKNSVAVSSGAQRSQSCSEPVEDRRWKTKVVTQPAIMDRVGVSHSYAAGILLSSENSRSVSAPITADRRLAWRAVVSSTAAATAPPHPERSISPESNDSISEELNHFKPIVCSPCTPPKRLPDGRLLEPAVVKSTPRNLTRGLQKATSYEASPAVLQKWRQIELDRQSLKTNSRATLTSPVNEGGRDGLRAANKRRLLFEPLAADAGSFQKHAVKIRVPAIRYSSEAGLRGSSDLRPAVGAPEPAGGGLLFSQKQSFSPYTKNSNFQSCKLVPKASPSPRKESDSSLHNQALSRRGTKREQKTKHLDSERDAEPKKSRSLTQEAFDERYVRQIQQECQDRAVALRLQRQFDRENQADDRRRSPERYFLRSWMSNQNLRLRRGLRRSRRINKKH